MKTKQMKLQSIPGMVGIGLIMALPVLTAISCRKNSSLPASPIGFQHIAIRLEGEIFKGSVSTESDDEGLVLWCNGGKTFIVLAKILS
jgi:hypothetical protein